MSDININPKSKFIFITGGVVSSLGKGLASASLAAILQARGYKVRMRKLDPYLNVDPGTMNPCQHGEVFVTDDGTEADLDLGHYERFSGVPAKRSDSITTGKIYQRVIDKERHGFYLGSTIQVIPHVTNEIKSKIESCKVPAIITGDMNSIPTSQEITTFKSDFDDLNDIWGWGENEGTFKGGGENANARIDYIFKSKNQFELVGYKIINKTFDGVNASDHFPIYAELKI